MKFRMTDHRIQKTNICFVLGFLFVFCSCSKDCDKDPESLLIASTKDINREGKYHMRAIDLECVGKSPNCVSSVTSGDRYIEPFKAWADKDSTLKNLKKMLEDFQEAKIENLDKKVGYLHMTFTTSWFRFVDDVEFLFEEKAQVVHVRSKSRKGYYDFGKNRERVEALRMSWDRFNQKE